MQPAGRIEGSKQMLSRGSSLRLLPALMLLALPFLPVRCLASDGKCTLDVGASRTPPLMQGFGASEFASMGVIRSISQHVGLQLRTSYRFPRGSAVRADFLPIGLEGSDSLEILIHSVNRVCSSRHCLLSSFLGGPTLAAR